MRSGSDCKSFREPSLRRSPHRSVASRRRARRQAGFTLIETMLALGVFMIGIAGIVTMQLAARRTRVSANDLSLATNIAASTLDGLETQDFDGLATTTDWYDRQGGQLGTADGAFFTVVTTVTADPTTPGELEDATAEVSWSVDGRPHGITLRTMVTR